MKNENYLAGVRAAQGYYNTHGHGFTKHIRAEDAIKMYLPPVEEHMSMMQTPLPKPRKDWIKGFKEEQESILSDERNMVRREGDKA